MGKPTSCEVSRNEYIVTWKQTQGIETSQYLKEKKSNEIPLVVASERGTAQWQICNKRKCLEMHTKVGDSPVRVKSIFVFE